MVDAPPTARFRFSPEIPTDLDTIEFWDLSVDRDGEIMKWPWEFGDGETSELQTPSHRYFDDGEYTVRLTVIDDDRVEASFTVVIPVENTSPVADFSFSPGQPTVDEPIQFTDLSHNPSPAGRIVFWGWDFGDGPALAGCSHPLHWFSEPGL